MLLLGGYLYIITYKIDMYIYYEVLLFI